jgi:ribosome biogenesis GTPase
MTGILLKAIAGFYYVEAGGNIYECKARGIFRKNHESPTVGDFLEFEILDGLKGVVSKILPRKNLLIRPPVANLDQIFIVSSHNTPAPNALLIDRLTAIAVNNNIEPIIVFNKVDLGGMSDWQSLYTKAGFKCIVSSVATGVGCDEIISLLEGKVSAFTGNSGVGKSSLLNRMFPTLGLETGEVSNKLGRGRHTTRHVELYPVCGGYVADTPGFSSLDIERTMPLKKDELPFVFPDFADYLGECKFTSCTHTVEKGCAVLEAVQNSKIEKTRAESYKIIYNEIKDIKEWEKR